MNKEIKIPEGYEAKIEGNKVILELKESEDERIRKWLYDYIKRVGRTWGKPGPFDYTQILTYLEKQKEQKPKVECDIAQPVEQDGTAESDYGICGDSVPGKLSAALRRHGWYLGHVGENQRMVEARKEEVMRNWPIDVDSLTQEKDLIMANSSQLEQKPVECIEFDNEFKNQVSHLLASVLNKEWDYNKEFVEYTTQQLLGYAKHEISPEGWSEEDERIRKVIVDLVSYGIVPEKEDREKCLTYLEKQKELPTNEEMLRTLRVEYEKGVADTIAKYEKKEQKPAEWSEEDEKIAKEIEEELWYPGDFPDYPSKEENELYDDCQRRLNWFKNKLKSLRPQPKQEQTENMEEKQKPVVQWPNLSNCKHDCKTCFARCFYRKEQNKEQYVELEEEIIRWLSEGDITDTRFDDYGDSDIESTARHFAKWGAAHPNIRKEK